MSVGLAPGLKEAVSRIAARAEEYRRLSRLADPSESSQHPAAFCAELLADLRAAAGEPAEALALAASAHPKLSLFHVLSAHLAREAGDFATVASHATAALALDQWDLYAQRMLLAASAGSLALETETDRWLRTRFCPRPFQVLETRTNGDASTCCSSWMPATIGNIYRQGAEEIWNSPAAREIRRSVLDGDFRYCSRMFCPKITSRALPRKDEMGPVGGLGRFEQRLARGPKRVLLSHDRSCNLSCPSCRTRVIVARKSEQERMAEVTESVLLPLMADARLVKITGSGDPFASNHFRQLMTRLDGAAFPDLKLEIQTNGLLLDRQSWAELRLDGRVDSIWVSIDAARRETYELVRRGGAFGKLLKSLVFISRMRRAGRFRFFELAFVVQWRNYREIPEAIALARRIGADSVSLQVIRNWGTFTLPEFQRHNIADPNHPEHAEFLQVLKDRRLLWPEVQLGNLAPLHAAALASKSSGNQRRSRSPGTGDL